jgi:glucan phosphoethanolaminetransferase (alkaline phosphatase superfamily)
MIKAQMKETVEASLLNFISMNMLLWLLLTIAVYSCAIKIYAFTKRYKWLNPILHPIIVCTVIIIVCINVASSSVIDYQQNTHLLSALLDPFISSTYDFIKNQLASFSANMRCGKSFSCTVLD